MFEVNRNPSPRELRRFGVTMLIGFGLLGGVAWCSAAIRSGDLAQLRWAGHWLQWLGCGAWVVGGALFGATFLPGNVATSVYVIWMRGATALGRAMSSILLTALFFVLLPPFALLVRASDPLRRKRKGLATYWENYRAYEATLDRMRRMF